MNPIFGGLITVIMDSISNGFRKKSLDMGKLSNKIFSFFGDISGFFFIVLVFFIFGFEKLILQNPLDILILLLLTIFETFNGFLIIKIYKKIKLSEILPYENLDSLFIIIFGFFLYYGSETPTSIITLFISIFTIFVIFLFSVNLKKIKVPKFLGWYIFSAIINAIIALVTGMLLFKYSSITYAGFSWLFGFLTTLIVIIISKKTLKVMFTQKKEFYLYRVLSSIFGRTGWILGIYIIKEAGLVVATLLGFLAIVFNVVSMKIILKDNPTKKQMILAFLVTLLVGVGYYFN